MNPKAAGSDQIRAELDRTRASLDRAFDALGTKLTPSQILWDGVGVFRSGAGTALSRAMDLARAYPLPASVIGVGVGWLLIEHARGGRGRGVYEGAAGTDYSERVSEAAETVKETAGRAVDTVKEQGSRVADTVRDQAAQAADAVKAQAARVGEQARHTARRTGGELERMLREDPLTVGLGALAVGLLVGFALPSTRREDEVLGEVRDRKLERAREAARDALEKGREVAKTTARTAVETAKETLRQEAPRPNLAPQVVEKIVGADQGPPPPPSTNPGR